MNEMTLPSRHRIRALAVWDRTRYLSVTEPPHNIGSLRLFVYLKHELQSRVRFFMKLAGLARQNWISWGIAKECQLPHLVIKWLSVTRGVPSPTWWPRVLLPIPTNVQMPYPTVFTWVLQISRSKLYYMLLSTNTIVLANIIMRLFNAHAYTFYLIFKTDINDIFQWI